MQYSPHNYVITTLKIHFFRKTLHHVINILSRQRFLLGIRAKIERDPNVNHAIITDSDIIPPLEDITAKQNACFLKDLQNMIHKNMPFPKIDIEALDTTFQEADVIWVIRAPE